MASSPNVTTKAADRSGTSLPLARIAAAVKAGDDVYDPAHHTKEQGIWKASAAGTAHIFENQWELLRRRSYPFDNGFDLRGKAGGHLRGTAVVPIAGFEYFRLQPA